MGTIVYILLGVTFLLHIGTYWLILTRPQGSRDLERAFDTLELDFERLTARVDSELGRISRLKRSTMDAAKIAAIEAGGPEAAPPVNGGMTPHQQEMQAKILSRRNRGA